LLPEADGELKSNGSQIVKVGEPNNCVLVVWNLRTYPHPAYALDGRDPSSCSGIFWRLGRYDRPWSPERSIFGAVRYMSSANPARKFRVKEYLRTYAAIPEKGIDFMTPGAQ